MTVSPPMCQKMTAMLGSVGRSFSCAKNLPEQGGKEIIALVDRDLLYAQNCANGKVLIGQKWLAVPKSTGQIIIRLENIRRIDRQGKNSTGLYLKSRITDVQQIVSCCEDGAAYEDGID